MLCTIQLPGSHLCSKKLACLKISIRDCWVLQLFYSMPETCCCLFISSKFKQSIYERKENLKRTQETNKASKDQDASETKSYMNYKHLPQERKMLTQKTNLKKNEELLDCTSCVFIHTETDFLEIKLGLCLCAPVSNPSAILWLKCGVPFGRCPGQNQDLLWGFLFALIK